VGDELPLVLGGYEGRKLDPNEVVSVAGVQGLRE
jgi:hypothetical protein